MGTGARHLFILIPHLYIHKVPAKHPREKILDPRNTHEKKFRTHEIPTRKNLDPWNTHKKKFWTHQLPTRKNLGPSKYPREKNFRPTKARWHDSTRPTNISTPFFSCLYNVFYSWSNMWIWAYSLDVLM